MITRTDVSSAAWVQISTPGKDFDAFLVDENIGSGDTADVRVVQATSLPATSYAATNGRRVTRPRFNTDLAFFESDDSTMYFYARCATNDATATIAVEPCEPRDINRLVDQGKLFFFQSRTRASDATRYFLIRTGAKRLNLFLTISAGLATQINFIEAPATVTAGALANIRNYNRNYPDNDLLSKVYAATAYTGGTNISPNQAGFGSNPWQAISGSSSEMVKYILKPNTDYVYELDPDALTDTLGRAVVWEDED